MTEMKKYMDIVRYGHQTTVGVLNPGDKIIVQEKLDGANASFKREGDEIVAFSRNIRLNKENNLRGFYEWTQTLNVEDLLPEEIYFGEWLVQHKLNYGQNANQFYLFDIYGEDIQQYYPFDLVKDEAERLNLNLIPVFYEGEYHSFEHLQLFVGKTLLGVDQGEGIVVKNVNYTDRFGNQLFMKLVSDAFREVQKQKAPKDPNFKSEAQAVIESVVTKARVEKLLYKLVDENLLHESFGIEDMGTILKLIGTRVYDDVVKEENDIIENYEEKEVRRFIGRLVPTLVKSVIQERVAA